MCKEREEKEETKVCGECGEEKLVNEFMKSGTKNGKQLYKYRCKVCEWFRNNDKSIVYGNWSLEEYRTIIDKLLNNKVNCINDILIYLNDKNIDDIVELLFSWKLKGINVKVKYNCDFCKKECYDTLAIYCKHKNHFCCKECYDKWQYDSIIVSCDYCGKDVEINKNKLETNEHIFCCHEHSIL